MNKNTLKTALDAFINFDYQQCALILAKEIQDDPQPIGVFLLVICLRKLNKPELIDNYSQLALNIWDSWEQDLTWEKRILALCVDLEDFESLRKEASDPVRKSQVYFYEGLKHLIDIENTFALTVDLLQRCADTNARTIETSMAGLLLGQIARNKFPDNLVRESFSSLYLDCVSDFIKQDLDAFLKHYASIVEIQNRHDLEEMLLFLFLMGDQHELAEAMFAPKIANWLTYYGEDWTPNLVALALGKIDQKTLLGKADNELKQGEAYYYIAMQALLNDKREEAKVAFEKCIALDLTKYSTEANLAALFYDKYFKGGASQETIFQVLENLEKIVSNPSSVSAFYEERRTRPSVAIQFQNYFQQEIPHEAIAIFRRCIEAFIMQQYEECVAFAAERLKHGMNVQAALMELISLQWLEKPEVAVARGRRYAEILENRFGEVWFAHLVRLFIGGISPEELLEHAKSPLQKFQALYYLGQYFYAKKQYQVAYDYLQQGVAAMPEEQGLEQANIDHTINEISVYLDDGNPETKKIPLPILRKLSAFEKILPQLDTIQNPAETYRIAREYADIFEAYYPNNKGILAKLYSSMSVANYDLGNIGDSESQIDHAIELLQNEDADGYRRVLISYRVQKSRILSHRGDMPAAQQILSEVLKDVDENDEDIFDYVDALENLGMNYGQLGQYEKAAPLLAKVVELFRQQGEDFKEHLARVITNEAGLHERMGEPFYAKSKYEEALSIMEQAVGKNNLSYARVLNYLAKCNKDLGFYHEALPQYKEAFALAERLVGKQHPFYATVLNNTGKLYEKLYDYEKAEKIFLECLELSRSIFGEYHPNYALANRNLAGIYANQGRFDEAFPLTLKAIQIWESFYGVDNPELATEYTSLAAIYFVNSVYDKAEHYYQKALQVVRHSLGTGHEMYVSALHAYAVAQFFSKRYEDSAASYREALLTAKNIFGSNHPDVSKLSHELANVLKTLGQNEEAISLLDEAIKIQDQFIENAFSVTSEDQRTRYLKNQLDVYHSYISAVVNFGSTDSELLKKAYEVVLKRKGISTEYLSNIHLAYLSRSDSVLKKKTLELFQIRENIFKSNFQVENRQPDENTIGRLIARQEALETEISLHFSGSYSFWKSQDWSFEKVLSAMDRELLYVDFIQFPNSLQLEHDSLSIHRSVNESTYAAFVVDPRSPSQIKLVNLGSALIIDHLIQHYRSLIIKQADVADVTKAGEVLYKLIIKPLLPFINECRKLMVSPDGLINVLPLQVLPIPNQDRQMIDDYEITHIPVIRDIVKYSAPRSIQSNEAVVVADPDFDYQNDVNSKGNFQRLPATKEEGESVADLLKVLPIMGKEAIKQRLLNVSSPTILHLATHGFFLEPLDADEKNSSNLNNLDKLRLLQNPLRRSGLALAGVNAWIRGLPTDSSVDNGMLSAEEVAQLDLRGTQLVILSACKTGLGNIEEGEGVVGMRRSFVLSGAQGLIMSLWSIPDEETKALVLTMYHEILSERSSNCVSALRQAQIAIREKYPHPLFWGGFIYQGDHRNSISLPK